MAIINLPGGAQWDTVLGYDKQTPEASSYMSTLVDNITPVIDAQEEIGAPGSGKYRWTARSFMDTPNGLKLTESRSYTFPPNHSESGALASFTFTISEI